MKLKFRFSLFIALILIFSFPVLANNLIVHYLDVGQADSILLQLPNHQNMLIDAGNNADGDFIVNYIRKLGIRKIDYLVGTHPHEDHIGGLDDVIKSFDIGTIYMPKVTTNTKTFEDVLRAAKAKNKKIIAAKAGMTMVNENDLKAYVLSPVTDDYEELNNWSIVIRVDYKDTSALFTGDAEEEVEFQLLAQSSNALRDIDVLKVGHHGSNSSTTEAFLNAVNPKYAIISVGKNNRYGHPSSEVINRLQRYEVEVFRTDEQGTIICTSDGNSINFNISPSMDNNTLNDSTMANVIISLVDLKDELVIIKNTGNKPVDLSGWKLVSVKGNQIFYFPGSIVLKPGQVIKVDSGKGAKAGSGQLKWTGKNIWNNDGDPAELFDSNGKLVSSY